MRADHEVHGLGVNTDGAERLNSLTSPSARAGSSAYLAINPSLGSLKSDGLGFRFRRNALVERHDDTGVTMRVVSRLPHLDHR